MESLVLFEFDDKIANKKRGKKPTAHAQSRRTFVIGGEIKKTTTDQGTSFSDFKKAINKIRNA